MRTKTSLLITSLMATTVMMTPLTAHAFSWNPMNWFAPSKLEQAQKAQEEATRAEARATTAQKQADAAKKRADVLKESLDADKSAKQEAYQKALAAAEARKEAAKAAEKKATPKTSETHWYNPISWFGSESPAPATKVATTPPVETPVPASEPLKEEEPQTQLATTDLSTETKPESDLPKLESTSDSKLSDSLASVSDKSDYLSLAKQMKAVTLETQKGNVVFELYPDEAPVTVANFVKLVSDNFYNQPGMKFHRVVPGFVIQTGDPTGTGAGGSKERIPLEIKNKLSHDAKGVVAMARGASPNSATSQFYITLAPQKTLDAKYAIFGRVVSGLEVLDKIEKGDIVYGAKLTDLRSVARDEDPSKKNALKKWLN